MKLARINKKVPIFLFLFGTVKMIQNLKIADKVLQMLKFISNLFKENPSTSFLITASVTATLLPSEK